jgi:hypothetical protein
MDVVQTAWSAAGRLVSSWAVRIFLSALRMRPVAVAGASISARAGVEPARAGRTPLLPRGHGKPFPGRRKTKALAGRRYQRFLPAKENTSKSAREFGGFSQAANTRVSSVRVHGLISRSLAVVQ